MITVYGIKNCGTVRKALKWLDGQSVPYRFHDYRKNGVDQNKLAAWSAQIGWENLLNKRGMTWRKLDDGKKSQVVDQNSALALLQEHSSAIKRPLFEKNGNEVIAVGFDEQTIKKLSSEV